MGRKPRATPKNAASNASETSAHQKAVLDSRVAIVNPLGGNSSATAVTALKEEPTTSVVTEQHPPVTLTSSVKPKIEPSDGTPVMTTASATGTAAQIKPRARKTIPVAEGVVSEPVVKKTRAHTPKAKSSESERAVSSGTPKGTLASPAPDIVLSTVDGHSQPENLKMTVYVGRSCRCAPLLDPKKVRSLGAQIGPGTVHHVLREVLQQIVNCSEQTATVFKRIDPGTPRIISVTAEMNGSTHVRAIPVVKNLSDAWAYLRSFLGKLEVCPNLCSPQPTGCPTCEPNEAEKSTAEHETSEPQQQAENGSPESGDSDESAEQQAAGDAQSESLSNWSVERVASDIEANFGQPIAARFALNQIDGKALTLLTTELLIRHLDMAFGPALKMMSYVDSLKSKYRRMSPGFNH